MNENAQRTIAIVQASRLVHGPQRSPRRARKLPRQARPTLIQREYGAALAALVSRAVIREAFAELLHELPDLLASVKRERGDASYLQIARIVDPVARVQTWLGLRRDADEGKRVRALVARAKERLHSSISTQAIEALAEKFAEQTSTFQRIQLNKQTKAALGVDIFRGDKNLRARVSLFASENVSLIKGISDEIATKVEKTVTRALTSATLHSDLARTLDKEFDYGEKRSKLIARDQIGKFYGQINASRQQELGVTKFRWKTVGDERVRGDPGGKYPDADSSHYDWDNEIFSYDDPPRDDKGVPVLPGEPILCRCWAEPVLDDLIGDV